MNIGLTTCLGRSGEVSIYCWREAKRYEIIDDEYSGKDLVSGFGINDLRLHASYMFCHDLFMDSFGPDGKYKRCTGCEFRL